MAQARNIAVGTVEGTGAAINVSVGFTPAHVMILNEDGLARLEWHTTMTDGHGIKTVTAGTISKITSLGITPYAGTTALSEGFTIGADTDINVDGETLHYFATGEF